MVISLLSWLDMYLYEIGTGFLMLILYYKILKLERNDRLTRIDLLWLEKDEAKFQAKYEELRKDLA